MALELARAHASRPAVAVSGVCAPAPVANQGLRRRLITVIRKLEALEQEFNFGDYTDPADPQADALAYLIGARSEAERALDLLQGGAAGVDWWSP